MSAAPQKPTNFPEMINQIQTKIDVSYLLFIF